MLQAGFRFRLSVSSLILMLILRYYHPLLEQQSLLLAVPCLLFLSHWITFPANRFSRPEHSGCYCCSILHPGLCFLILASGDRFRSPDPFSLLAISFLCPAIRVLCHPHASIHFLASESFYDTHLMPPVKMMIQETACQNCISQRNMKLTLSFRLMDSSSVILFSFTSTWTFDSDNSFRTFSSSVLELSNSSSFV